MSAAHHLKADKKVTSTGTLVSGACTLLGIHWGSSATAGRLTLRDDGATGTILVDITTPAVKEGDVMMFPEPGIKFDTDIHATLTDVDAVTAVYRE